MGGRALDKSVRGPRVSGPPDESAHSPRVSGPLAESVRSPRVSGPPDESVRSPRVIGPLAESVRYPPLPTPLRVELEGGAGAPLRASVSGEVDYAGAFSMQVRIAAACRRRRARGLIVDLAGTEFMSLSGLDALLSLRHERACRRGGLVLARPAAQVRDLLRHTGPGWRLLVVDTLAEAEHLLQSNTGRDVVSLRPRAGAGHG